MQSFFFSILSLPYANSDTAYHLNSTSMCLSFLSVDRFLLAHLEILISRYVLLGFFPDKFVRLASCLARSSFTAPFLLEPPLSVNA